jgi:membrane protein DedA with SNARE-associated domain
MLGDVLNSLSQWVQDTVSAHGLSAVFVLMVLESACIPIPSEVTMIFAGYLVSQGEMGFWAAVLAGTFGNLVGSWIAWYVGAYGVDSALLRWGHQQKHLAQAQRWFDRHGTPVVFFSRMLPVIRTFISLPAGMARMPLGRFTVLTFLGCLPWCILLVWMGDTAGSNWEDWQEKLHLLDYPIIAALAALVALWLLRRWRRSAG